MNEAKDDCKDSIKDKRIIHILIDNYLIDNKFYQELPNNLKCKNFSLDLSFICLPEDLIKNIEKILENYQISINRILSATILKSTQKRKFRFF